MKGVTIKVLELLQQKVGKETMRYCLHYCALLNAKLGVQVLFIYQRNIEGNPDEKLFIHEMNAALQKSVYKLRMLSQKIGHDNFVTSLIVPFHNFQK